MAVHSMCQPGRPGAEHLVVPGGSPSRAAAPQQRVERVALAGPLGVAAALGEHLEHLVAGPVRDVAEGRRLGEVEVDVLARALAGRHRDAVCRTGVHQPAHGRGDLVDGLDDAAVGVRGDDAERGHVLAEEVDLGGGQLAPVPPVALGPLEQRVVDVGDVLDVRRPGGRRRAAPGRRGRR